MSTPPPLSAVAERPLRVELDAPPLVRAGITSMLRAHAQRVRVLEPGSEEAGDVALVDLLGARARRPSWSTLPLVALVPEDDAAMRAAADLMGAVRVISVDAPSHEMARTIVSAYTDPVQAGVHVRTDAHPDVLLSPREAEILSLISHGRSNEEVTQELYLSLNTVKSHIRSAYRKIGVTTRAQAVIWCFTHGERVVVPHDASALAGG